MKQNDSSIFGVEQKRLKQAQDIANDQKFVGNALLDDYLVLLDNYKKMFSQFRRMVKISDRNQNKLNQALTKVDISSAKIKNLLNNTGQGFLSFGKDLKVDKEYSDECHSIFHDNINGKHFSDLVFPDDDEQNKFLSNTLQDIFLETDELTIEVFISLLPSESTVHDQHILIEYRHIQDPECDDNKIMIAILTNITEKRILENQLEMDRNVLRMIVQAVTDQDVLRELLNDYTQFCKHGIVELLASENTPTSTLSEIFRQIHTFKGLFAQMEWAHVGHHLHELETEIGKLQNNPSADVMNQLHALIASSDMQEWLEQDRKILIETLGESFFQQADNILVSLEKVKAIESSLIENMSVDELPIFLHSVQRLRYISILGLLKSYPSYVAKLANKLEKEIHPFKIEGDDILVDPELYHNFIRSLVHVFRNCVDHGIETMDCRIDHGKAQVGLISCRVEQQTDGFNIIIVDDGQGIDCDCIREKATQLGLIDANKMAVMTEDDVLNLIFAEGFSVKDQVSQISGRGVGLAAVKLELAKLGGQCSIKTTLSKGSCFTFWLPELKTISQQKYSVGELLQPVILRTHDYFAEKLQIQVPNRPIQIQHVHRMELKHITVFIGTAGILHGTFALTFNKLLAYALTEQFMHTSCLDAGKISDNMDEAIWGEILAEIVNTIVANAMTVFPSIILKHASIKPPLVLRSNQSYLTGPQDEMCVAQIETEKGDCCVFYIGPEFNTSMLYNA